MTTHVMTASEESGAILYLTELAADLDTTARTAKRWCRAAGIPILRFSARREAINRRDYAVLMARAAERGKVA